MGEGKIARFLSCRREAVYFLSLHSVGRGTAERDRCQLPTTAQHDGGVHFTSSAAHSAQGGTEEGELVRKQSRAAGAGQLSLGQPFLPGFSLGDPDHFHSGLAVDSL